MEMKAVFKACDVDYFGYVSAANMMRVINELVAQANYEDGVGFSHLYPTYGITWMLGQCVLECRRFLPCVEEVTMHIGGHEQFGVSTIRRCTMYHDGELAMTFTTKMLPVYFDARKVVPPQVLQPIWKTEAEPCGENVFFIRPPEGMETVEELTIHHRDCDSNKHLTAFRYVELALDAVGYWTEHPRVVERMQIDYVRECLPGDKLRLQHKLIEDIHYVSGVKADGTVSFNATVKLSRETYPIAKIVHV